ncbi:hypothetical protein Tco_0626800 [Tanacetum coccineum]|uniref:Uncharacterized protein n=1 Tax=Tanacetum coccineum TaxID=301880 RepID=A0ABQ4WKW9_9ASTR
MGSQGFEFKAMDYTVIDSPRAVTFRDRYGVQMIMRFNEIHKFSDGTLQQIDEALDYRVKEFQINRTNPGMHTRFWTKKDVDRSKDFMFAIQKRLKTRRIFRNLESFVGGRIREGDYRNQRLIVDIETKYHGTRDKMLNLSPSTQDPSKDSCFISHGDQYNSIVSLTPKHPSDTKVLTMKMEILLEPTSNKLLEIRLKMNLPDHRIKQKLEMETPRSSRVNSPRNAHS